MKEPILILLNENIDQIFGSTLDEEGVSYAEVYKYELYDKANQISEVIKESLYENDLELGHIIKFIFTSCFRDCINLNNNIYIELGKKISQLK